MLHACGTVQAPGPPPASPPLLRLDSARFDDLQAWTQSDPTGALRAFVRSCAALAAKSDYAPLGGVSYAGTVGEWRGVCDTAALVSAYGALKILSEALKRAGKDVSREKLVDILEGFYDYSTGVTHPITYGPNARVGAMGAYVIAIDLKDQQFISVSPWIRVN